MPLGFVSSRLLPEESPSTRKGFLPGRALLEHVVDVEEQMLKRALADEDCSALFFDFKAAFPSITQHLLWETLELFGFPAAYITAIRRLYANNQHQLVQPMIQLLPQSSILRLQLLKPMYLLFVIQMRKEMLYWRMEELEECLIASEQKLEEV